MKTFKALFIDNGVIKAGEFPVEPDSCCLPFCETDGTDIEYCKCHKLEIEYEQALASAKANAVECEDQGGAKAILWPVDRDFWCRQANGKIIPLPSGWDYRVVKRCTNCERLGCESISCRDPYDGSMSYTQVAILYRTTEQPEPEESQEEIFDDLFSQYFKMLHEGHSMCKTGEILRERFTISRKP